jgi:hypothetical protein
MFSQPIRAVVASVHGVGKIEAGLSDYYMVDEIQSTYRVNMIAIPRKIGGFLPNAIENTG